jgi:hypothetical protein
MMCSVTPKSLLLFRDLWKLEMATCFVKQYSRYLHDVPIFNEATNDTLQYACVRISRLYVEY